jgi:hypothetical protein
MGAGSTAMGQGSTAVGAGSTVGPGLTNSSAFGAGSAANRDNQMVFGTREQTYTAPGMNTDLSRARQSGPLGVVTSDNFGNLASDNGALYKEVASAKSGAAVAMALSDPTLGPKERVGVKLSYGRFDGANAIGFNAVGVFGRNLMLAGDRLTFSAGVGWGNATVSNYSRDIIGTRAGMQWTW